MYISPAPTQTAYNICKKLQKVQLNFQYSLDGGTTWSTAQAMATIMTMLGYLQSKLYVYINK